MYTTAKPYIVSHPTVIFYRFDINGFVTGFGNPDWERTHEPASQTSPVVSALVDAGATCVGKTVLDEMSFGLVILNYFPIFTFVYQVFRPTS